MITNKEAIAYFKRHLDLYCVDGISREAEEMAIKALEQTRWIPISEQLPGEKGSYLICLDNEYIASAYYDGNQWYIGSDKERIVAWMPLPQPYKTESEEIK